LNKPGEHTDIQYYVNGIRNGNTAVLSRAITLVESTKNEHRQLANDILDAVISSTGNSFRMAITGVPGVGKSTFIESFGKELLKHQHRIAILAIDPSSTITKGSILGDKTRMTSLAAEQNVFIRPSPSAGALGGVARATYESILLCEAAGYDFIMVETVGVGQSETAVSKMTDFFLLLMLAGAGDDLQGIKRGIMEMADAIAITKADGSNLDAAKSARAQYAGAVHFFPPKENGWICPVEVCSSMNGFGMDTLYEVIDKFKRQQVQNGFFHSNRRKQQFEIISETLQHEIIHQFYRQNDIQEKLNELQTKEILNPFAEAVKMLQNINTIK